MLWRGKLTVSCPGCGEKYPVKGFDLAVTEHVTMICVKCKTHFNVAPRALIGWRFPAVSRRVN